MGSLRQGSELYVVSCGSGAVKKRGAVKSSQWERDCETKCCLFLMKCLERGIIHEWGKLDIWRMV